MNTLLIVTTIQAWFFLSLILSTKREKQSSDFILAAWLFIIGLHTLIYYITHSQHSINLYLAIFNASIPFLQGPMLLLYISRKSAHRSKSSRLESLHFIPFLSFLAYQLINTSNFGGPRSDESRHVFISFFQDFNAFGLFFLISLPFYIGYSFWLSKKAHQEQVIWTRLLILFVTGIWLSSLISLLLPDLIDHKDQIQFNALVFVTLTGFVYAVSYLGFREQLFSTDIPKLGGEKYQKSKLQPEEIDLLWQKLEQHMNSENPFLDAALNQQQLADQLGISTHKLSQVINTKAELSFNDYVNGFRINRVKSLIFDDAFAHYSLLGIALESGFTSKATFNRVFKKFEDCTPSEWKKSHSPS